MTETRLRTWTHGTGYVLATLFILALAMQNLRYGFYELFYLATGMATLTLAGLRIPQYAVVTSCRHRDT